MYSLDFILKKCTLESLLAMHIVKYLVLALFFAIFSPFAGADVSLVSGWNMVGNASTSPIIVSSTFNDSSKYTTVWKWNASSKNWMFYTPSLTDGGAAYAGTKGYEFLTSINTSEGFWINAAKDSVFLTNQSSPINQGAISIYPTSYENFKEVGLSGIVLPKVLRGDGSVFNAYGSLASTVADFDKRGKLDLFVATINYSPDKSTAQTATMGQFRFFKLLSDGTYSEDTTKLSNNTGCLHPRKAIVADFNSDGQPDIFVVCHGYDANPFPGETNKVVLSQANGTYLISDASADLGFWHGATALDVDGDGDIDLIATNNFDANRVVTFLNNGKGSFVREVKNRFPKLVGNYYSIEAIKVDGDSYPDILLGGHEWNDGGVVGAKTLILRGNVSNDYTVSTQTVIPAIPNEGVVLDFTVTGSGDGKTLWISRTSGGDGTFYQSVTLQKYVVSTGASTTVFSQRNGYWIPWLIANNNKIKAVSDLFNFEYQY